MKKNDQQTHFTFTKKGVLLGLISYLILIAIVVINFNH